MISFIKEWVFNIITLVLFIVIIETLVPSGRMRKYASLVTGFILIIAIINPFLKLMGGKINLTDIQLSNSSYIDKMEIAKDSSLLEENQMKQIVEVYRKKIIEQLEQSAKGIKEVEQVKADVIINEDYNSANFGEIKRVYLEISLEEVSSMIKPVKKVEKVEIDNKNNTSNGLTSNNADNRTNNSPDNIGDKEDESVSAALKKQLEDRLASIFNIDKNNIVISMLKQS